MDATKLVVGQDVNLDTGLTNLSGRVVKITWWSVYVQIGGSGEPIRFDKKGVQCGVDPLSLVGPMEIDEVPYAERRQTKREQRSREFQPFIAWWKTASYEQRLTLISKYYATLVPALRPTSIVGSEVDAETIARLDDISSMGFLLDELAKITAIAVP